MRKVFIACGLGLDFGFGYGVKSLQSAALFCKVFIPLTSNEKAQAFLAGLFAFFLSISIITVGVELTCNVDVVAFQRVRWIWDLTCDFWAENAKNKCKRNKQKRLAVSPFEIR